MSLKFFLKWGEDGIIQHLLDVVEIKNRTFIEFGVEDFLESNCRFLMEKNNWRGCVIDGSLANIEKVRSSSFYWRYDLKAIGEFITKENINDLLGRSGFDSDLGILSIDIDGNDFHILNAIEKFKPRILICEYNSIFGVERAITVPYQENFNRTAAHYSNLYYGASLPALEYWANNNGYSLVTVNSTGSNAFFIRNDLLTNRLKAKKSDELFFTTNVRESRDKEGKLTYLSGEERINLIRGMPVLNVISMQHEIL